MDKLNQCNKILRYLQEFGPITSMQAVRRLNILRPSNRIQELKARGYNINTEIIYETKEDGSHTHYAKYTLLEDRA